MKKLFLILVVLLCSVGGLSAQSNIFNNPNNKNYWGVRAGIELANAKDNRGHYDIKPGVSIGVINNVPLVANFYIEPALKFYYDSYSQTDTYVVGGAAKVKDTYHKFGFRIPVMGGYRFDFTNDLRVNLFTGPVFEMGLWAKERTKWDFGSTNTSDLYNDSGSMDRVDIKWGFGAGVSYKSYYFEASGAAGLLNLKKAEDKYRENIVTISVGYNF